MELYGSNLPATHYNKPKPYCSVVHNYSVHIHVLVFLFEARSNKGQLLHACVLHTDFCTDRWYVATGTLICELL